MTPATLTKKEIERAEKIGVRRAVIQASGTTMTEIAARCGVSLQFVVMVVNGHRKTYWIQVAIAHFTGFKLEFLFGEPARMPEGRDALMLAERLNLKYCALRAGCERPFVDMSVCECCEKC